MHGIKRPLMLLTLMSLGLWTGACGLPENGGGGDHNANDNGNANGENGSDGNGTANGDMTMVGGLVAEIPMTEQEEAAFRAANAECLACHESINPTMMQDYMFSNKAKAGLPCTACHEENPAVPAGNEGHRRLPTPETCGACHPNQYAGHRANRHSIAYIRMLECGRYDDFPTEYGVGSGYHFNEDDVAQLAEIMDSAGHLQPGDISVTSLEMCGQCHNVENRCDSCHFRHRFSTQEARNPMACATCHMGPDHPQIEMYQHSKHGSRFEVYGDTETVPVCVDCHMPYNTQMLGQKTDAGGNAYTDHNLAMGIAYGPVGGGTTRSSHVLEGATDRVKFTARDGDAEYPDGLWLERTDRKIYDAATGGSVAYDNLADLAYADASGNGKQDYVVVQAADSADMLLDQRAFMRDQVCGRCHSENFADEQLLVADLIHENTKTMQMEAFDMVRAMAIIGELHVNTADRPGNLETGTTGLYGANMILRNLDAIEATYFELLKYDNVKTWKGAYHQNPDYTHWYGWQALTLHLDEIASEASDLVLTGLWMNGLDYPGATGNLVEDQLYQGVIYDTASMVNLYDKFPGPDDPAADQDIDVDMDGTPEFQAVEGAPGSFAYDGGEITFH